MLGEETEVQGNPYPNASLPNRMPNPTPKLTVELVEASPARFVLDIGPGRVIVELTSVRFHKNGRGKGVTLLEDGSAAR